MDFLHQALILLQLLFHRFCDFILPGSHANTPPGTAAGALEKVKSESNELTIHTGNPTTDEHR